MRLTFLLLLPAIALADTGGVPTCAAFAQLMGACSGCAP